MRYLVVVSVRARSLSGDRFAIEGAFADHLKALRELLSDEVDEIVVAGVEMSQENYESRRPTLGELDRQRDRVSFVPLFPEDVGRITFWTRWWPRVLATLTREVRKAGAVHASPSHDVWFPTEVASLALGEAFGRTTISVTDIDQRKSARMMYETGRWSKRIYLTVRYLYDPIRDLQQRWIAHACDLVLFKGDSLVRDYGNGKANVHGFFDPNFEAEQIVDDAFIEAKAARLTGSDAPVRFLYFGRFVFYKGVHHMIDAFAAANLDNAELHLLGLGEMEEELRSQVKARGIEDRVTFIPPVGYDQLLSTIRDYDVMLAAPLGVDTPRSTWDSFACALPVLAYDTDFYRDLGELFGCVDVVAWNDVNALTDGMRRIANDRPRIAEMSRAAVDAARTNTQREWLKRRVEWTREAFQQNA